MADITDLLAAHLPVVAHNRNRVSCYAPGHPECRWEWHGIGYTEGLRAHAAHVLAELRSAGWELVQLPKVERDGDNAIVQVDTGRPQDNPHLRVEPTNEWGERVIRPLGVPLPVRGSGAARSLGTAFLAAARTVDQDAP